ncbi:MAG: alkane 1-monooxygenase, partial [Arsenicicoccus sp.]
TTYTFDPELRRRSYRMLAEAWGLSGTGSSVDVLADTA